MSRKIVAIGGGLNGRILSDGRKEPYETGPMDKEIIRLTGKEKPNFLFIAHSQSQSIDVQKSYFETMKRIYDGFYGCECRVLLSTELINNEYTRQQVMWADIIYEGGGNTLDMIKLWEETGFDKVLRQAWEDGKVMCGVSAGASCWFNECSTDSLKIKYGPEQPLIGMECLGFVDGLFVPHCDEEGRYESVKDLLKTSNQIGLSISNCSALEIIDDEYRLLTSDASNYGFKAYGLKSYWEDGEYLEQKMDDSSEFKSLDNLLSKNIKRNIK